MLRSLVGSEMCIRDRYTAHIESILVLIRVLAVLAVPVLAVPTGRNTASTLSTRVPPPKVICFNSHSWDHLSTVNAVCNMMRMKLSKRRCTDRWSEYAPYSQYTALIEIILLVLRVLAVLTAPVLPVPVLAVTTGRNTASTANTRVPPPESNLL